MSATSIEPAGEVFPAIFQSDPRAVSTAVDVAYEGALSLLSALVDGTEGEGGSILLLLGGTTTRIEAAENW